MLLNVVLKHKRKLPGYHKWPPQQILALHYVFENLHDCLLLAIKLEKWPSVVFFPDVSKESPSYLFITSGGCYIKVDGR